MSEPEQKFIVSSDNMKIYGNRIASAATRYVQNNEASVANNMPQRMHGYVQGISTPLSDLHNQVGVQIPFSAHSIPVSDMLCVVSNVRSASHKKIPIDIPKTSLDMFMERLENQDRNLFQESLSSMHSLPYVTDIKFEELDSPTIIIMLSNMDEETERMIYQIEYNLLKSSKNNIDFLILPD